MTTHKFTQVDVFGSTPLKGNPLAVVHDADDLTTEQMQEFAQWTNLSETTFLLKPTHPDADYRVRIFTPSEEFPFAGHPTLGSAHAWLAAGGQPKTVGRVVQECGVGNVQLKSVDSELAFAAPELLKHEPLTQQELSQVAQSLQITPDAILDSHWIDNGPGWIGVRLSSAQEVLDLAPNYDAMQGMCISVIGEYPHHSTEKQNGIDVEVRAFVPDVGILEDPVTGSANAGLAQWLTATGTLPDSYTARQGTVIGYDGLVTLNREAETVWVGGKSVVIISGTVDI